MARLEDVGRNLAAVTPSDTVPLAKGAADGFWIGTGGDISLRGEDGDNVTLTNVPAGVLPIGALYVNATGTTASDIVAIYGA